MPVRAADTLGCLLGKSQGHEATHPKGKRSVYGLFFLSLEIVFKFCVGSPGLLICSQPAVRQVSFFALLAHFQFETLCVSNHTACRFAEKRGFSVV